MEINVIAREDQADKCAEMIKEEMVRAFNKYAPSVPMEAVAAIGDSWIH